MKNGRMFIINQGYTSLKGTVPLEMFIYSTSCSKSLWFSSVEHTIRYFEECISIFAHITKKSIGSSVVCTPFSIKISSFVLHNTDLEPRYQHKNTHTTTWSTESQKILKFFLSKLHTPNAKYLVVVYVLFWANRVAGVCFWHNWVTPPFPPKNWCEVTQNSSELLILAWDQLKQQCDSARRTFSTWQRPNGSFMCLELKNLRCVEKTCFRLLTFVVLSCVVLVTWICWSV